MVSRLSSHTTQTSQHFTRFIALAFSTTTSLHTMHGLTVANFGVYNRVSS